jgi:hypothetical protein
MDRRRREDLVGTRMVVAQIHYSRQIYRPSRKCHPSLDREPVKAESPECGRSEAFVERFARCRIGSSTDSYDSSIGLMWVARRAGRVHAILRVRESVAILPSADDMAAGTSQDVGQIPELVHDSASRQR